MAKVIITVEDTDDGEIKIDIRRADGEELIKKNENGDLIACSPAIDCGVSMIMFARNRK